MYAPELEKQLRKLERKAPLRVEVVRKKAEEICQNPYHYKPLRDDLHGKRHVHINSSFILTFSIDESTRTVRFLALRHHKVAYSLNLQDIGTIPNKKR